MIRQIKVIPYKEILHCSCGGVMEYTGVSKDSYNFTYTDYTHKCKTCGKKETKESVYPRIIYKEQND